MENIGHVTNECMKVSVKTLEAIQPIGVRELLNYLEGWNLADGAGETNEALNHGPQSSVYQLESLTDMSCDCGSRAFNSLPRISGNLIDFKFSIGNISRFLHLELLISLQRVTTEHHRAQCSASFHADLLFCFGDSAVWLHKDLAISPGRAHVLLCVSARCSHDLCSSAGLSTAPNSGSIQPVGGRGQWNDY